MLQFEHVSPLPSHAKKEIKPDTDQQTPYACCRRRRRRDSDPLRTGRSGNLILVGARFSAPVQTDPGAHPASYTMGPGS
jgi:hypothetical protein